MTLTDWRVGAWRSVAAMAVLMAASNLACAAERSVEPLVQVQGAWIRQAVKGQSGTGGFMQLTSRQALTLTGFRTPVAASAELHEMRMDGDVMRMGAIDALPLPAGQAVALQPGGYHLMLMGLKKALPTGSKVPVTLLLRTSDGHVLKQTLQVPVLASAPTDKPH